MHASLFALVSVHNAAWLDNWRGIFNDKSNASVSKNHSSTENLDATAPVAFNGLSPSFQVDACNEGLLRVI